MEKFRPDSLDGIIYGMITHLNEYHLPDQLEPNDIIIDIGAHLGYFSEAVLRRGAGKVVCIEANHVNFSILQRNLQPYQQGGKVDLRCSAVWRSDANEDVIYHNGFADIHYQDGRVVTNTGSSFISTKGGDFSPHQIALDQLLVEITNNRAQRIRLLKIDCEGSEWPILLTAKELALVDEIHGEYHVPNAPLPFPDFLDIGLQYNEHLLKEFLEKQGFRVHIVPVNEHSDAKWLGMGMFYASRIQDPSTFQHSGKLI